MKKGKTMHELAKEFPDKTYRELEIYREKDRQQEAGACIMGEMRKDRENTKPNEGEEQDNPTLWELAEEYNVSYADAVPIQENMRLKKEAQIEAAKIKKDISETDKLKKRAQEAEGELSIMKGIETNRVKEAQARSNQLELEVAALKQQLHVDREELQSHLDRAKRDNNDLFNRIADSLEVNESHQKLNGKLQERLTELEEENKKMHAHLNERVDASRKAGM